jgi:hypothetical protein
MLRNVSEIINANSFIMHAHEWSDKKDSPIGSLSLSSWVNLQELRTKDQSEKQEDFVKLKRYW